MVGFGIVSFPLVISLLDRYCSVREVTYMYGEGDTVAYYNSEDAVRNAFLRRCWVTWAAAGPIDSIPFAQNIRFWRPEGSAVVALSSWLGVYSKEFIYI